MGISSQLSSQLSRRLIALSRQGGVSPKDANTAKDSAGKPGKSANAGKAGKQEQKKNRKLSTSQSAPTLISTMSGTAASGTVAGTARRGGGWNLPNINGQYR